MYDFSDKLLDISPHVCHLTQQRQLGLYCPLLLDESNKPLQTSISFHSRLYFNSICMLQSGLFQMIHLKMKEFVDRSLFFLQLVDPHSRFLGTLNCKLKNLELDRLLQWWSFGSHTCVTHEEWCVTHALENKKETSRCDDVRYFHMFG